MRFEHWFSPADGEIGFFQSYLYISPIFKWRPLEFPHVVPAVLRTSHIRACGLGNLTLVFWIYPNSFMCSRPRRRREHQEKIRRWEHKAELGVGYRASRQVYGDPQRTADFLELPVRNPHIRIPFWSLFPYNSSSESTLSPAGLWSLSTISL